MESTADAAIRYLQSAKELRKVAAVIKDEKSREIVLEAAQHYVELAAQQTVKDSISA